MGNVGTIVENGLTQYPPGMNKGSFENMVKEQKNKVIFASSSLSIHAYKILAKLLIRDQYFKFSV